MCFDTRLLRALELAATGAATVDDLRKEVDDAYIKDLQGRGFIEIDSNGKVTITDMGRGILEKIHSGQGNSII